MQISTEPSKANINLILAHLGQVPIQLKTLSEAYPEEHLRLALAKEKRSFFEELSHLLNCEARVSEAIYLALLLKEPSVAVIHPERQWAKLISYEHLSFTSLLNYFGMRRSILMSVLSSLEEKTWQRVVQEKGKKRKESVYWKARALVLHELHHLNLIEARLS